MPQRICIVYTSQVLLITTWINYYYPTASCPAKIPFIVFSLVFDLCIYCVGGAVTYHVWGRTDWRSEFYFELKEDKRRHVAAHSSGIMFVVCDAPHLLLSI